MKRIPVSDETWRKLNDLKVENGCESFDELITMLIEPSRKPKIKEKFKWADFKKRFDIL